MATAAQKRLASALAYLSGPAVKLTEAGQLQAADLAKKLARPYTITKVSIPPSTAATVRDVGPGLKYQVGRCHTFVPADGRPRVDCPKCLRIIFMGEWFTHPCGDKEWESEATISLYAVHCRCHGQAAPRHTYAASDPDLLPKRCPSCDTHPEMAIGIPPVYGHTLETLQDARENMWRLMFPSAMAFESEGMAA